MRSLVQRGGGAAARLPTQASRDELGQESSILPDGIFRSLPIVVSGGRAHFEKYFPVMPCTEREKPQKHRAKLHSTNPTERPNGGLNAAPRLSASFPTRKPIVRLLGALLMEGNDECTVQRGKYLTPEP